MGLMRRIVQVLAPGVVAAERGDAARSVWTAALREANMLEQLHGYRRLSEGGGGERLNPLDQDTLLRIVRALWARNPLARRLVDIVHDYVANVELTFGARTLDVVQEWARDFWDHPRNDLAALLPRLGARLYLDGEVLLPFDVNSQNGALSVRWHDPMDIARLEPAPGDPAKIDTVVLKSRADGTQPRWRVARYREQATVQVGEADTGNARERDASGFRTGECWYWRTNDLVDGRGRSGLEAVIDWVDIHDRTFYDQLRNVATQDAFVYDITLKGATPEMVQARRMELTAEGPPRSGSLRVHNDMEEWKALAPDINPTITGDLLVQARKVIGLGAGGRSETWVAAAEDVNRSTAEVADTPPMRNLERFQAEFERNVRHLVETALDYGVLYGTLPADLSPEERAVRIATPDLGAKDSLATAQALAALVPALELAENRQYMDKATARRLVFATAGEEMPEDLEANIQAEQMAQDAELLAGAAEGYAGLNGMLEAITKTEGGVQHPASHYLYVPDPNAPSTWKLRYRDAQGNVDPRLLGAAQAALTVGFRGNRVQLPPDDRRTVARRLARLMRELDMNPSAELLAL